MSLSILSLSLLLFFLGAQWMGLFVVSPTLLGVFAWVTAGLLLLEGGPVLYKKYFVR